jgi:hypothetical protein
MIGIVHDSVISDDERRWELYHGTIFTSNQTDATKAFCAFADELIREEFGGLDPETAQHDIDVNEFAAILSRLKPRFIHHRRSRQLLKDVLDERGCDLDRTYFDVPRLRSSTSHGYLTSGIAYAWHPHRDTWYSAPMSQLNFWMPVYEIEVGNGMAFHLDHFDSPVPNTSDTYNYYEWNQKYRAEAADNVEVETRPLPRPLDEGQPSTPVVLVQHVGELIEFSGQHLHSSVPNQTGKTRFSIDFRTVHIHDIVQGLGAKNVDAHCTGSSIRDFIRASDFNPMPEEIVSMFNDGTESNGQLLYEANIHDRATADAVSTQSAPK